MRNEEVYTAELARARGCPNDELLVAYAAHAVASNEADRIEAHLDHCDPCVALVMVAQQRLSQDAYLTEPVPNSVRHRMAAAAPQPAARSAGDRVPVPRKTRLARRLPAISPWRWVLPPALAAGVLLAVASQTWLASSPTRPLTRALPMSQQVRVTLPQALVRMQPSLNAEVIMTLARGDVVEVGDEDREWYRVVLPGGGAGWVERRAFR